MEHKESEESLVKIWQAGAHVILGDVNLGGAEKTVAEIKGRGGKASAVKIRCFKCRGCQSVFDSIIKEYKPVDIVFNNAGITREGLLVRMKEVDWDLVLNINLKVVFFLASRLRNK
ncbi:MAG: hypothetical protein Ct9H300mP23_05190 [Nitrospinota bacterium]|nr:MAG: hypothetical protein Ct9H300mP23_05190 [Nitrospinota bacterium]